MKAIIWIIILALVAWGIWWFVGDNEAVADFDNPSAVQGDFDTDADVDLGEFESKG